MRKPTRFKKKIRHAQVYLVCMDCGSKYKSSGKISDKSKKICLKCGSDRLKRELIWQQK